MSKIDLVNRVPYTPDYIDRRMNGGQSANITKAYRFQIGKRSSSITVHIKSDLTKQVIETMKYELLCFVFDLLASRTNLIIKSEAWLGVLRE